jgi:hypothetical protein
MDSDMAVSCGIGRFKSRNENEGRPAARHTFMNRLHSALKCAAVNGSPFGRRKTNQRGIRGFCLRARSSTAAIFAEIGTSIALPVLLRRIRMVVGYTSIHVRSINSDSPMPVRTARSMISDGLDSRLGNYRLMNLNSRFLTAGVAEH